MDLIYRSSGCDEICMESLLKMVAICNEGLNQLLDYRK